ncbi:MAG: hypothetical protein WCJ01_03060 [Ignavibacteria bacterium]
MILKKDMKCSSRWGEVEYPSSMAKMFATRQLKLFYTTYQKQIYSILAEQMLRKNIKL